MSNHWSSETIAAFGAAATCSHGMRNPMRCLRCTETLRCANCGDKAVVLRGDSSPDGWQQVGTDSADIHGILLSQPLWNCASCSRLTVKP